MSSEEEPSLISSDGEMDYSDDDAYSMSSDGGSYDLGEEAPSASKVKKKESGDEQLSLRCVLSMLSAGEMFFLFLFLQPALSPLSRSSAASEASRTRSRGP